MRTILSIVFGHLESFEESDGLETIRIVRFLTPSSQSNVVCEYFRESFRSVTNFVV